MFSNFTICVNAILPLVIYLVIGLLVRKLGIISLEETHRFNRIIFLVFFPFMMFDNIYSADIKQAFDPFFIAYGECFILAFFALTWKFVTKIEKNDRTRGALIQAIYRSNFVLLGLPIAINLFGRGSVSETATLIMFIVPTYNVLAVITLEHFRGGKVSIATLMRKVITNPIIVGAIVGLAALLFNITLPTPVEHVSRAMADSTAPIALILLGASFDIRSVGESKRNIRIAVAGKLIVQPMLGLLIAIALGFRGIQLVSYVVMMAAPTAVSSYTMADAMDSDGDLAANAVVLTMPISCVVLFLWLFVLKNLGMF